MTNFAWPTTYTRYSPRTRASQNRVGTFVQVGYGLGSLNGYYVYADKQSSKFVEAICRRVQFIINFNAILRADAVVVPVKPISVMEELRRLVEDRGAKVMIN